MSHPPQPHQPGAGSPWPPPGPPMTPGPAMTPGPGGWQQPVSPPPVAPPGPGFADYLVRLTGAGDIKVSPREQAALLAAGVRETGPQRLLVWRRTMLIVLLPVLLASLVLMLWNQIRQSSGGEFEYFTPLGIALLWLPIVTWALVPLGTLTAIVRWTELRWSSRVLFWSWLVATAVPLLTALIPIDWQIDLRDLAVSVLYTDVSSYDEIPGAVSADQLAEIDAQIAEMTLINNLVFSVGFALVLLPIIVGLVGGVLRGARRTRGMLPSAVLPSWFVLVAAPFYTIIMLTVFAVISPVLGSGLLTTGILLVALAPLVYVVAGRRYAEPMHRGDPRSPGMKIALTSLAISLPGLILIVVYIFTGEALGREFLGTQGQVDDQEAFQSYLGLSEAAISLFARFQLTSVVMTFLFTRLVYREWRMVSTMSDQVRDEYVVEMQALERFEESSAAESGPQPTAQPSAPLLGHQGQGHQGQGYQEQGHQASPPLHGQPGSVPPGHRQPQHPRPPHGYPDQGPPPHRPGGR